VQWGLSTMGIGEECSKNASEALRGWMMQIDKHDSRKGPAATGRSRVERREPHHPDAQLTLPQHVYVKAPGLGLELSTVEGCIKFIDRHVPAELVVLPRWTFARALLVEALKTRKTRDLRAAVRQLSQALSNERWLDVRRIGKE
jgi:hypothetical protein